MSDDLISLGTDQDRPARADALHNRAEILRAAATLFDEYGVEHVSMSQIGREADVGKGTLYRHFRNKADLCHALLDSEQRVLQERTLNHLRTTTDAPCEQLLWFLEELLMFTGKYIDLLVEATQSRFLQNEIGFEHPAHHWQRLTIIGLLRQTDFEGDIEYTADVFYALTDPRLYHFQRRVKGYDHQRIVAGFLDMMRRILF